MVAFEMQNKEAITAIENVLDTIGCKDEEERSYIYQLMTTAGKLEEDGAGLLELKILTSSMKELRYAYKIFDQYRDRRKVSVFGSSRVDPDDPNYRMAEEFSSKAVQDGYMIISGAGPGIMEAANKGAGRDQSFGLNIHVPHEQQANKYIDEDKKCINFRYFFSRKLIFCKESDAAVFFPGGFGTHDELFELLCLMQTGRHHLVPIILCDQDGFWDEFLQYVENKLVRRGMINKEDLQLLDLVDSSEEILDIINHFYQNFHSERFVGDDFVIRFRDFPGNEALRSLADEFGELCPESGFKVVRGPIEGEESGAPSDLYRLIFRMTNHDYGELHRLINFINDWI